MINIIGKSKLWFTISLLMISIGIGSMVFNVLTRGKIMNFGIDFTGGTILNLRFDQPAQLDRVRTILAKYNLAQSSLQRVGDNDLAIRSEPIDNEIRTKIMEDITREFGKVELLEADTIGPVIGQELRTQALLALIVASIGILIFVAFRFEFKYALAALMALYHDAIIMTGFAALLWLNVESTFVAAILTILGYSINDTIVIFDRIRENISYAGKQKKPFTAIVNESVNQTMARSINTVLTVVVMNLCLAIKRC